MSPSDSWIHGFLHLTTVFFTLFLSNYPKKMFRKMCFTERTSVKISAPQVQVKRFTVVTDTTPGGSEGSLAESGSLSDEFHTPLATL